MHCSSFFDARNTGHVLCFPPQFFFCLITLSVLSSYVSNLNILDLWLHVALFFTSLGPAVLEIYLVYVNISMFDCYETNYFMIVVYLFSCVRLTHHRRRPRSIRPPRLPRHRQCRAADPSPACLHRRSRWSGALDWYKLSPFSSIPS